MPDPTCGGFSLAPGLWRRGIDELEPLTGSQSIIANIEAGAVGVLDGNPDLGAVIEDWPGAGYPTASQQEYERGECMQERAVRRFARRSIH